MWVFFITYFSLLIKLLQIGIQPIIILQHLVEKVSAYPIHIRRRKYTNIWWSFTRDNFLELFLTGMWVIFIAYLSLLMKLLQIGIQPIVILHHFVEKVSAYTIHIRRRKYTNFWRSFTRDNFLELFWPECE